ncbi:DUF6884 domain-containing protein [Pararhizobium haloflavum]|uniref:DUF6884 domain-containing protein n=1 Tax=Pararhizobium haloflavum TaxID=2037914 RepID=UPI000C18B3B4
MSRVILVSCVAGKRSRATLAANLYTSAWFVKARVLVEASGDPWFILSAEHGLLAPDRVIEPYERTLNTMSVADRRAWAQQVQEQMEETIPEVGEVVVMAGNRYRENLMPYLRERFTKVTVPMDGLTIGRQLSWLHHAAAL